MVAGSRWPSVLQHLQPPVYEVECELVDAGGTYLAARTDEQVAASLALKAQLLLAEESALEARG